jgi:hypothetical protein
LRDGFASAGEDFGILFTGRVVDALGDAVSPAALTHAVVTATRSSAALAVILTCGILPRVALLPFAGVVVDRLGARLVAFASDAVCGLAQLVISLLLLGGHLAIAPVAGAAAVGGAGSAFGVPTTLPFVSGTIKGPAGHEDWHGKRPADCRNAAEDPCDRHPWPSQHDVNPLETRHSTGGGSDIGPIDERLRRSPYLLEAVLGKRLDRARAL